MNRLVLPAMRNNPEQTHRVRCSPLPDIQPDKSGARIYVRPPIAFTPELLEAVLGKEPINVSLDLIQDNPGVTVLLATSSAFNRSDRAPDLDMIVHRVLEYALGNAVILAADPEPFANPL